jgi:dihydrofolate reductase
MRKVILKINVSLDGFIAGSDGAMDWLISDDAEAWQDFSNLMQSAAIFLLGRIMYPNLWQDLHHNQQGRNRYPEVQTSRIASIA